MLECGEKVEVMVGGRPRICRPSLVVGMRLDSQPKGFGVKPQCLQFTFKAFFIVIPYSPPPPLLLKDHRKNTLGQRKVTNKQKPQPEAQRDTFLFESIHLLSMDPALPRTTFLTRPL